jgi:hypothetical protein
MLMATPMFLSGGIASAHLLWLERSTVLWHVVFGMLLIVPMKIFEVSLSRKGVGFKLQPRCASSPTSGAVAACRGAPPFAGNEDDRDSERPLYEPKCIFFVQGCFCKSCHVNLDLNM